MINAFYSSSIWAMEPSLITVETDIRNGIPMFNMVGSVVVMDNAMSEIKQYGSYITKSNDDDGVAYALEKYL